MSDDYVPLANFGKDHWSTLAYADTIIPDHRGFQVGFDGRMRQGRAHFRVMQRDCPHARRDRQVSAIVMDNRHSTVLKDGTTVSGHDDWHCVQDLVAAGLMGVKRDGLIVPLVEEVEPAVDLFLTPLGEKFITALKRHKADGGSFKTWTAIDHMDMAFEHFVDESVEAQIREIEAI
jgi:hypothetical protein